MGPSSVGLDVWAVFDRWMKGEPVQKLLEGHCDQQRQGVVRRWMWLWCASTIFYPSSIWFQSDPAQVSWFLSVLTCLNFLCARKVPWDAPGMHGATSNSCSYTSFTPWLPHRSKDLQRKWGPQAPRQNFATSKTQKRPWNFMKLKLPLNNHFPMSLHYRKLPIPPKWAHANPHRCPERSLKWPGSWLVAPSRQLSSAAKNVNPGSLDQIGWNRFIDRRHTHKRREIPQISWMFVEDNNPPCQRTRGQRSILVWSWHIMAFPSHQGPNSSDSNGDGPAPARTRPVGRVSQVRDEEN